MANRNWGAITSGETFEALATTIVFFEDSKAALFGRQGRDGGQDARSGDGKLVFQVKHHADGFAADAIRDALREAEKIEKYRQAGHARHSQWAQVTHWRLVTNAAFNPTDQQNWDAKVVPRFNQIGLVADYWERATLDGLLDRHPEIHRSFFGNQTRVFLTIPEVAEKLPAQEPFLRRDQLGPFCGRMPERQEIRGFLASEKLFLVVHGAGGTGKTRLLVEAGSEIASEGEWQVLWTNVESMAATSAWFESIVPERATLLLVDEPADENILQQLAEQLGGRVGRTSKWKVVVAVRSPKDPVLRFIRGARMSHLVQELALFPLPRADAEEMCFQLLNSGKRANLSEGVKRDAARQISQQFASHPVWLTLAIKHLEDHGDLKRVPTDVGALADAYLVEIEKSQSDITPESVREMLRWVALIGAANRHDDSTIKLIGQACGLTSDVEVRGRLAALVRRGALSERGAHNRFVELKPDVLRDHVLLRWLARDTGAPRPEVSDDGKVILENVRNALAKGALSGLGRAILVTLARTEFILRHAGHEFDLLGGFFNTLEASVPTMSTATRVALTDTLEKIAHFRPRAVASIARVLRQTSAPDETIDSLRAPRVVGQADVALALAWPLFSAAMGAQTPEDKELVLRELCELAATEAELVPSLPRGLPNDGRRAATLVTSVLEGGPQFWSEYDDTASQIGTEVIVALTKQAPSRGQVALLEALVRPLLKTERRQTWADDQFIKWRTFAIVRGGAAWTARESVLAQLKGALEAAAIPSESRAQLWHLFSRAQDGNALERLRWTHDVLTSRAAGIDELSAAREVWDWHRRFDQDPEVKAVAEALEDLYVSNELAKEFQPLLPSIEDWEKNVGNALSKAQELARASSPNDISAFLDRAVSFLQGDRSLFQLSRVATSLGTFAESRDVVRTFIGESLKPPTVDPRAEFGVEAAVNWIIDVRRTVPERAHLLVRELLDLCGSDERRAHLLERIYGRIPKLLAVGDFTPEERKLLFDSHGLFKRTGRDAPFVGALALSIVPEWPALRPLLDATLESVPKERLSQTLHTLVDAVYWSVHDHIGSLPPVGLAEWLMNWLVELPDFDEVGGGEEWRLTEALKHIGRPDVMWLSIALQKRQRMETESGEETRFRAVSHGARVSKYVRQIDNSSATDPRVLAAVDELMNFVLNSGSVGYYLPEIILDIDPKGLVAPSAVVARAGSAVDGEYLRRLARVGGAYAVNSPPWRAIASATILASTPLGAEAQRSVHTSLDGMGVRSWSRARGEVPSIFHSAVTDARATLDAELQPELRPFWRQRLAFAEAELLDEQERAKEERGE